MKDNINEKLNKLYPEVPESFHNKVTETLEGLDEHKDIPIRKHNRGLKIAVACAAITVVGAFTVASAAAINFFGLFSEKVGNYGLHVGVEQSTEESSANEVKSDPDKSEKHYKIVASYVPEGFKNEVDNPLVCHYHYGDKVFENRDLDYHIRASKEQYYDETYDNVIKSENDKVNGRDVVYMTFQYGENEEKLIYGAVVYFKDEGYIVYVNNSDLNELKKIVAGLSLEEDTEYEEHRANNETSDNQNNKFDYSGTDFDSKLVKVEGNTLTTKVEEKEEKNGETKYENSANLSIRIKNTEEMTNDNELVMDCFPHEQGMNEKIIYSLHDRYFNSDGTFKSQFVRDLYEDDGEDNYDSLGHSEHIDMTRHFYIVSLEVSSDSTIKNLKNILSFSAVKSTTAENSDCFYTDENGNSWSHSIQTGEADCIYVEELDDNSTIEKGQIKIIKLGLIVDDDILDSTYAEIGVTENYYVDYGDEIIKRNITSSCIKLIK